MAQKKVLVVEDNPMNLELAVDLLEMAGYVVTQAETAEAGIALAKAESPDLILMDIGLPGLDGLTATGILKQDSETKDIPIVAMTAHAMSGDEGKALAAGCEGYMAKPIDTRAFPRTVAGFIRSTGSDG